MRRHVNDAERRALLGRRHALAPAHYTHSTVQAADAVVAVHGTDPASTFLAILARSRNLSIEDVEEALYEKRSIVRVLGMRRTVFAVNHELAPAIWVASKETVARDQRRILERLIVESAVTAHPSRWIERAELRLLELIDANPGVTSPQLAAADELLGHRVRIGGNSPNAATVSVASRLLTLLSAEGRVVRGRPLGGWTSTQFTWSSTDHWRGDWPPAPSPEEADRQLTLHWLARYGPATLEDMAWWMGWNKGRTKKAIAAAGAIEVSLDGGPGWILQPDLESESSNDSWVALLPGLDPTTMGWKNRGFYLDQYSERVFDGNGNAGPTVWVNGRVIGGWTQRESGEIRFQLFEDHGREVTESIERKATALELLLSEVRLKPRARGYTPTELALR